METVRTPVHDELPFWEGMVAERRYPSYTSEIEKRIILQAHSLIKKPTTALEVGCEGGRWSELLIDLGWTLTCTDITPQSIDYCKKRIPTAECILVDPSDTTFPVATESVELFLCIEVPPVIHADWFFDEAFRVLQKRGLVVGVFWNVQSWRGLLAHLRSHGYWYTHAASYRAWREKLRKKGFTLLHEEGCCWPPFQRMSNSPLIPVTTQMERYLGLHKLVNFSPLIMFIARKD